MPIILLLDPLAAECLKHRSVYGFVRLIVTGCTMWIIWEFSALSPLSFVLNLLKLY